MPLHHLERTWSARVAGLPAWVVVTQLFIGLGWLRAAAEKIVDPAWWRGDGVVRFLADHDGRALTWFEPFLELVVTPRVVVVAAIVVVLQLAAGATLVAGRHAAVGLAVGIGLNLVFLASGAVNPSAFYLLAQGALVLWAVERRRGHRRETAIVTAAAVALTLAVVSLPDVATLAPAAVVDDPAVMFVLGGTLGAMGCGLVLAPAGGRAHPAGR